MCKKKVIDYFDYYYSIRLFFIKLTVCFKLSSKLIIKLTNVGFLKDFLNKNYLYIILIIKYLDYFFITLDLKYYYLFFNNIFSINIFYL